MFNKIVSTLLVAVLMLPMLLIAPSEVNAAKGKTNEPNISTTSMINTIKPYVKVTNKGKIKLKTNKLPEGFYEEYNLNELEKHFDKLNELSENGRITINKDLSIDDNSISMLSATYGRWTYHWYGYDRMFTNEQTKDYILYLDTVLEGSTFIAFGTASFLPTVAILGTMSTAYFGLLSSRLAANNKGNGVWVSCSWVGLFDVESL